MDSQRRPSYRVDPHDRHDYAESRSGEWLRLAWQYGFALIFAVVTMVYGLYFGNQLLKTQRDGIESISRIEIFEQEQVYQLRMISERLYAIESKVNDSAAGTED